MDVFNKIKAKVIVNPDEAKAKKETRIKELIGKLREVNSDIKKYTSEVISMDKEMRGLTYDIEKLELGQEGEIMARMRTKSLSRTIVQSKKKLDKLHEEQEKIKETLERLSGKYDLPKLEISTKKQSSSSRKEPSVLIPKIVSPFQRPSPSKRSLQSRVKSKINKNPKAVKAVGAGVAVLGAYGLYKAIKRSSAKRKSTPKRKPKK